MASEGTVQLLAQVMSLESVRELSRTPVACSYYYVYYFVLSWQILIDSNQDDQWPIFGTSSLKFRLTNGGMYNNKAQFAQTLYLSTFFKVVDLSIHFVGKYSTLFHYIYLTSYVTSYFSATDYYYWDYCKYECILSLL